MYHVHANHPIVGETVLRFSSHAEAWEYYRTFGDIYPVGFPQWDKSACSACNPE